MASRTLSFVVGLCLFAASSSCHIWKCCGNEYHSYIDEQTSVPTCQQVVQWCSFYSKGCALNDDDGYTDAALQSINIAPSSSSSNKSLTSGESAMIAVGAILVVAIVAAVGVSVWRKNEVSERSDSIELTENLVGEVAESPRRSDQTGMLTVMTVISCIVAVVALIVAVVAISDKSHSSSPASSSSGNSLEATQSQSIQMSNIQLRTGPAKLAMTGMISSHPWCHQTTLHWASCTQLQDNMKTLIDAIGSQEADVNATMRMVNEGRAGNRTFVIDNNAFIAAAPQLKRISANLFQPHELANTSVCTHFTPTSKQVCVSMHTSLATNESVLFAYLNPNTKSASKRTRRHHSFGQDLSNNWHGSWNGAEHAVENGAIHGAESGAWHGAISGAVAGIAGGPAGVIGGALSGAATGAIKGAISGGISGGEHYVESNAINDAISTAGDEFGGDDGSDDY